MASRSKSKKKPLVKKNEEYTKQIHCLRIFLKYTLRSIDGKSKELDDLFTNQANRIKGQIKELEGNQ